MAQLNSEQLEFLRLVSRAATSNPFGADRREADLELSGGQPHWPREKVIEALAARVDRGMRELTAVHPRLRDVPTEHRALMRHAIGFHLFHQFSPQLDRHIEDQVAAGDQPVALTCGPELMAALGRHGIVKADAARHIAWYFQMRRAFYFIDRGLLGCSPCMQQLRQALWNNVFTHELGRYERSLWDRMEDFSTLLLGATGTGKGNAAAAIGRSAYIPYDSRTQCFAASFVDAFVEVNLSQYPESLIESELFGHRKGAFTGAVEHHRGAFARCSPHGAIFLDEIGEVAIPVQIKLLRVLQERVYSPVGSHERDAFRGRVIAATHQPLDRLREEGRFRDDFYYRLCSDRIVVPSLRQRIAQDARELRLLVGRLCARIVGRDDAATADELVERIEQQLGLDYPWPGNVRELEQCIRRLLICGRYEGDRRRPPGEREVGEECSARELVQQYCRQLYARYGSYEEVARRVELDRRTVKKYVDEASREG